MDREERELRDRLTALDRERQVILQRLEAIEAAKPPAERDVINELGLWQDLG